MYARIIICQSILARLYRIRAFLNFNILFNRIIHQADRYYKLISIPLLLNRYKQIMHVQIDYYLFATIYINIVPSKQPKKLFQWCIKIQLSTYFFSASNQYIHIETYKCADIAILDCCFIYIFSHEIYIFPITKYILSLVVVYFSSQHISYKTPNTLMEQSQLTITHTRLSRVNLPMCLLSDALSGLFSALTVSPFCAIIDRSVIQNANGSVPLFAGVRSGLTDMIVNPAEFARRKQFQLLYFVYASTYVAANASESTCEWLGINPVIPKLFTTFLANTSTGIYKDKTLTQLYGKGEVKPFPMISYGLFWFRDVITIAFAFTFPKILGRMVADRTDISYSVANKAFQLICPLAIQFVATPMHLLGLNYYNNPDRTFAERMHFLRLKTAETLVVRMARFLPAYGLGGVLNIMLRENMERSFLKNLEH